MTAPDFRLEPPAGPRQIGVCAGCGDPVMEGEDYCGFECGWLIHDNNDCKVGVVEKILGRMGR